MGPGLGFRDFENATNNANTICSDFWWEGLFLLDYEQRAILWNGSTDISPERRLAKLILHMDATARQVCLFTGIDSPMEGDDVRMVPQTSRDYFRPDAADRISTQVDKFTSNVRTDQ